MPYFMHKIVINLNSQVEKKKNRCFHVSVDCNCIFWATWCLKCSVALICPVMLRMHDTFVCLSWDERRKSFLSAAETWCLCMNLIGFKDILLRHRNMMQVNYEYIFFFWYVAYVCLCIFFDDIFFYFPTVGMTWLWVPHFTLTVWKIREEQCISSWMKMGLSKRPPPWWWRVHQPQPLDLQWPLLVMPTKMDSKV